MSKVKGVVAAGHPATAEAGRKMLENGHNAVDTALAMVFTSWVVEPLLTSPAGGGFALVHDVKSGRQKVFDFFVTMPGKGLENSGRFKAELVKTIANFEDGSSQEFHGGHASVAVPGAVAGVCALQARYGSVPLTRVLEPAIEFAQHGVPVTPYQASLINGILPEVIKVTPESEKLFTGQSGLLKEEEIFKNLGLADVLGQLALTGAEGFYRGEIARRILEEIERGGGLLTAEDLASYQVVEREPKTISYRGETLVTNPFPSAAGGELIAHTMGLLEKVDLAKMGYGSAQHIRTLVDAIIETANDRPGLLKEKSAEDTYEDKMGLPAQEAKRGSRLGNTTHISVIDAEGNAVSITSSNGAGSGVAVPGTGILLNNMLGEEDLNPKGWHKHPVGARLSSMMAPTLIMEKNEPRLALGSAGSNRIRSAILQVILNILDFKMDVQRAIEEPRIHVEGPGKPVQVEEGVSETTIEELVDAGFEVEKRKVNLYFGGVQAVERDPKTGELSGAGDPRRGGVAVVAK